jgi:hypothetical protein
MGFWDRTILIGFFPIIEELAHGAVGILNRSGIGGVVFGQC